MTKYSGGHIISVYSYPRTSLSPTHLQIKMVRMKYLGVLHLHMRKYICFGGFHFLSLESVIRMGYFSQLRYTQLTHLNNNYAIHKFRVESYQSC